MTKNILDSDKRRVIALQTDVIERGQFFLAGGTGLGVRLRHRVSRDIDWFTSKPFDATQVALPVCRPMGPPFCRVMGPGRRIEQRGWRLPRNGFCVHRSKSSLRAIPRSEVLQGHGATPGQAGRRDVDRAGIR